MPPPALRAVRIGLLVAAGWLQGCLFDEDPACFTDEECRATGAGAQCVNRACVGRIGADGAPEPDAASDGRAPDGATLDATPDPDGTAPDGRAPDAGEMDLARPDMAPRDMARPDVLEPDVREPDVREPDMAPVDIDPGPDMDPCRANVELCNGRDDDCDAVVDEDAAQCDVPANCRWRHRGSHTYLFCDGGVAQAEANRICADVLPLRMAVPENCNEADWLFATGNLVPTPVAWNDADRGRAWWLGIFLAQPDDGDTAFRIDGIEGDFEACWLRDEPDSDIVGEICVDLYYSRDKGDWGWNDEHCATDPITNPINALCEVPCDPEVDADGDGEDSCFDCDDGDGTANSRQVDNCPPIPQEGLPPD